MKIKINDNQILKLILGNNDSNITIFKDYLNIDISCFQDSLNISLVDDEERINKLFNFLIKIIKINNNNLKKNDLIYILEAYKLDKLAAIEKVFLNKDYIVKTKQGNIITAKSVNQGDYFNLMKNHPLVFAIGPAGCGKTYLAVAYACRLLKDNVIKKIILTRPAVEAGESLGFLPGDLKEKIDPYLRPLYDALYEILGKDYVDDKIASMTIEIAPLAYMRGRTLDNAFVILDEAQNTTYQQMKMFLTRMGFNSKMVITGDITQVDLPKGIKSGLLEASKILAHDDKIKFLEFDKIDIVRHPLVKRIIKHYEEYERSNSK